MKIEVDPLEMRELMLCVINFVNMMRNSHRVLAKHDPEYGRIIRGSHDLTNELERLEAGATRILSQIAIRSERG